MSPRSNPSTRVAAPPVDGNAAPSATANGGARDVVGPVPADPGGQDAIEFTSEEEPEPLDFDWPLIPPKQTFRVAVTLTMVGRGKPLPFSIGEFNDDPEEEEA